MDSVGGCAEGITSEVPSAAIQSVHSFEVNLLKRDAEHFGVDLSRLGKHKCNRIRCVMAITVATRLVWQAKSPLGVSVL